MIRIPFPTVPKARPRSTIRGSRIHTYTEPKYADYLQAASEIAAYQWKGDPADADKTPVWVEMDLHPDEAFVSVRSAAPATRKGMGRADIDNLAGAVLDALQRAGVLENDRNVVRLSVRMHGK